MSYRDDLQALEARHAALDAEVTRQTYERDNTRSLLEQTKARMRLPVLDQIRVASPCSESWDAMVGDDRVRHCRVCDKDVFNLSGMVRDEAEELIAAKHGRLCVRYFKRVDGTILTSDCPVGKRRARRRRLVIAGAAVLVAAAGAIGYEVTNASRVTMGKPMPIAGVSARPASAVEPHPVVEVKGDIAVDPEQPHVEMMGQTVAPLR